MAQGSLFHIKFKSRLQSIGAQGIFLFQFFVCPPHSRGLPFLYMAIWITLHPSTWTTTDLYLDACPIRTSLEVVKCAISCEMFRGHSAINSASWVGAMHWMQRWWVFYLDISLLFCLHISTSFLGILSFGPSGLLKAFKVMLTLWTPQAISFFDFTSRALIYVLDQN